MALTRIGLGGPTKSYLTSGVIANKAAATLPKSPIGYSPGIVPHKNDDLHRFLQDELNRIASTIQMLAAGHLEPTYSVPSRARNGDIRYADGVTWDAGAGEGLYVFFNGGWHSAAANEAYAQLTSTVNQVPVDTNPALVTFDSDDEIQGVTHNAGVVTLQTSGIYQFIYGAQVAKTGSGAADSVWHWLRRNGADVPRSGITTTITNQADSLIAVLNYTSRLVAGETIELYQRVSATTRFPGIYVSAPANVPLVPSVILSVNKFI